MSLPHSASAAAEYVQHGMFYRTQATEIDVATNSTNYKLGNCLMKRKWFAVTLAGLALAPVAAWLQPDVAHAVSFAPPPDRIAPQQSMGGASRSGFFAPPPGRTAPRQSTGGASRDSFFSPPPGRTAPQQSIGGASRDSFFSPPPGRTTPQQAAGGSSRTNAYGDYLVGGEGTRSMLALTPDSFYGTTLRARPTILVYVPASSATKGVFSLNDESQDSIYQVEVPLSAEGGVVAIELPEMAPALKLEENYQWFFSLKLEDALTPASPFVSGWVQRIAPTTEQAQALATDEPISHIAALGAQGIWYDTAAELAALHAAEPNETVAKHWQELLESVGLIELAAVSIVEL